MDLVSIIVPVYNVEKYLDICLESIIHQTYSNLEVILVDDGSKDNSGKICESWAKKDGRITVIHKENGGLSDARNIGIDNANGEWILFVDSDDFIHKDLVKLSLEEAMKCNADMVVFGYLEVDEECNQIHSKITNIKENIYTGQELLNEFVRNGKGSMVAWNKLYKRKIWKNLRYPVGKIHEDEFVIIDILESVDMAILFSEELYYYRQREGSIMHTKALEAAYDALEAFEIRYRKLSYNRELSGYVLTEILSYIINIYQEERDKDKKKMLLKKFRSSFFDTKKRGANRKGLFVLYCFYVSPFIYKHILNVVNKK